MKIGNGCATVTGYKLPQATGCKGWEGGSEVKPRVRISASQRSSGGFSIENRHFSVIEKDET